MHWGENYLLSNGFKEARDEIEWLLCDLMHYKRSDLYLNSEQKVNQVILQMMLAYLVDQLI